MSLNISNTSSFCFINCSLFDNPNVNAILCKGGIIKKIGLSHEIAGDKIIDLQGGVVYPGFTDSHLHLLGLGKSLKTLDLRNSSDPKQILDMLQQKIKKLNKDEWLHGWGWDQNSWKNTEYPHKKMLDSVSLDVPICLKRIDGHAAWVNSKALNIAGITKTSNIPRGGKLLRDDEGELSGILIDNAVELLNPVIPKTSIEEKKTVILDALPYLNRLGITSIHDAGTDFETLEILKQLINEKLLTISVYAMLTDDPETYEKYLTSGPFIEKSGSLTIKSLKLCLDGALGSRGAALLSSYNDDPKNCGLILLDTKKTIEKVSKFNTAGFQVCLHCIGDRANRIGLDIFEKGGNKSLRNRIEHAQIIHPDDLNRFSKLGVIPSMQPIHCTSDMPWIKNRLGTRDKNSYKWGSLLRSGTIIPGGSDAPIESPSPIEGIYAAVTRKNSSGFPKDGWQSSQCLSIDQAILMYTEWPAHASFQENFRGKIKPGFRADFSVLSQNLSSIHSEEILSTKVLFTIVNGKLVYSS